MIVPPKITSASLASMNTYLVGPMMLWYSLPVVFTSNSRLLDTLKTVPPANVICRVRPPPKRAGRSRLCKRSGCCLSPCRCISPDVDAPSCLPATIGVSFGRNEGRSPCSSDDALSIQGLHWPEGLGGQVIDNYSVPSSEYIPLMRDRKWRSIHGINVIRPGYNPPGATVIRR